MLIPDHNNEYCRHTTVNDMMMLIASFSGKVYSLRAQENRKKRKQEQSKV